MRWSIPPVLVLLLAACSPIDTGVGSAGQPAPDGGPVWTGGGSADAGGADAGTPGGADGGSVDAGTPASACDGLVPTGSPQAQESAVAHASDEVCWYAISDGQGNVAAERHADESGSDARWQIWTPGGLGSGSLRAGFDLHGEASGFTGVQRTDGQSSLVRFSATGAELGRTLLGGKDCSGSAFAAAGSGTLVLGSCADGVLTLSRFDGDGKLAASRAVSDQKISALGLVDDRGRIFLVASPAQALGRKTQYAGRWFDASLVPLTDWFELPGSGNEAFLARLIGGGAAVRIGGTWTSVVGSGASTYADAPAWLTARPRHDLQIVRGGHGYVLIPKYGAAQARNELEIYDQGGNRCGTGTFPAEGLSVGADGTVIGSGGDGGCRIRFWPGVLR